MGAYRELLAQAKKANHTAIQKLYERYYTLLLQLQLCKWPL